MEGKVTRVNESKVSTGIEWLRLIWQLPLLTLIVIVMTALVLSVVVASNPIMIFLIATGIAPFANVAWSLAGISVIAGVIMVVMVIVLIVKSGFGDERLQRKPYYDQE